MHEGHRERIREKYLKTGIDSFSQHEIMELILYYAIPRGNTNEIAHRLIDEFGSVANVLDADSNDILNIKGAGSQTAVLLRLIKDLTSYYHRCSWSQSVTLRNTDETGLYILDMIGNPSDECFYVLCLDAGNKVISFSQLEQGTAACANVSIRKVLECAVRLRAVSVVLAHNHPSGRLIPSDSDLILTNTMQNAFEPFGINVLDHIITGGGGYISLAQKGYMK